MTKSNAMSCVGVVLDMHSIKDVGAS